MRNIAGAFAIAGALLFVLSVFIQTGVGGDDLDTDAGLLTQYAEDGNTLVIGRLLYSVCMLCFIPALYVLFKAGQARAPDRVRGSMVAFAFIGPVLLAAQAPILAVGLKDAGEQFAEEAPAIEAQQAQGQADAGAGDEGLQAQNGQGADAAQGGDGDQAPGSDQDQAADEGQSGGDEVTTTPTEEGTTTSSDEGDGDESDDPREQLAEDLVEDNGTVSFSRALLLPALLGMVTGMVFINLWAMRTGLLTRFMASFGMALGVSLILLPFSQLVLIMWFLALGLILIGRWPGGRPPAWDAGKAIPWLKPGEEPPDEGPPGPEQPIEGSGRQMSGDAPDMPTDIPDRGGTGGGLPPGQGGEGNADGHNGQQPPRKRKRRG